VEEGERKDGSVQEKEDNRMAELRRKACSRFLTGARVFEDDARTKSVQCGTKGGKKNDG